MTIRLALSAAAFAAWLAAAALAQSPPAVVLFTLDGSRIEEMFFGVDTAILRAQSKPGQRLEDHELYKRYWAPTPQARREKLMPFFWGTLMRQHGSIAGNPALRSRVYVTNRHLISYPGYSELLVGRALDDQIKSNTPTQTRIAPCWNSCNRRTGCRNSRWRCSRHGPTFARLSSKRKAP